MEPGSSVLKLGQPDGEQQRIAPIDELEEVIDFTGLAVAAVVCEAMVERGASLLAGDARIRQD